MTSPVSEVVKIIQDEETIAAMVLSAVKEISVRDSPILYLIPARLFRGWLELLHSIKYVFGVGWERECETSCLTISCRTNGYDDRSLFDELMSLV